MSVGNPAKRPLVSIGIPTYNGARRINKALESIRNQPIESLEVIISDNASTDNTKAICEAAAKEDPRICYFRQEENKGVTPNFEFVLRKATGKYFMWLSDDDELNTGVLKKYVEFMELHPEYALVSGQINYWKDGKLRGREQGFDFEGTGPIRRTLRYYKKVKEGALLYGLMRRRNGQKLRLWSTIGSDWHFVAGLAFQGKIKNLDFVGYNKEAGGVSKSFRNYAKVFGESLIWGYLPYTKIAIDAFAEIVWRNPIYKEDLNLIKRLCYGSVAAFYIWFHYNGLILPRIIGGKVLRLLNIKTPRERKLEAMKIEESQT